MSRFIRELRRLIRPREGRVAFEAERRMVRAATDMPEVDPRFKADMERLAARPDESILFGTSVAAPELRVRLPVRDVAGTGHALVLGGNGSGKTRALAGLLRHWLRRMALQPESCGLAVDDHKNDLVALVQDIIADIVVEEPALGQRLLDRLVVIDPFSSDALVPLDLLARDESVEPEVQAYEVTSLIDRLGGADLGVRQDAFLYHLVLCGILAGFSLPELAELVQDPARLAALAARSPSDEVRGYFAGAQRIGSQSLEGVRARLSRLLRLPSARLMLGAGRGRPVSFHDLLGSKILLVKTGAPPLGCEDLGRFWSGVLTLKIIRGLFQRTPDEARRPVLIVVDEWQEGLLAGGDIAEHYERVLSMARSRGVSFWLCSQSLAGAARVSATLPKIVATNCNVHMLFKASPEDSMALAAAGVLPVTGRRLRPAPLPWEERPRSPYLEPDAERRMLVEQVATLPSRTFYLWNRNRPYRAELVRSVDVDPRGESRLDPRTRERLRRGTLARPIAELEADRERRADAVFRPIRTNPQIDLAEPGRRPRRTPRE